MNIKLMNIKLMNIELKNTLIKFLNMMIGMKTKCNGFKYVGNEDFVMENGKVSENQEYPRKYIKDRGEKKLCFMNAYNLSMLYPELKYVEGYAMGSRVPIAIHHAWCVDEEGKVVDPTWDDQENCVYLGVEFNKEYILKTILKNKHYGIIDNFTERYPLIRGIEGHTKKDFGF